MADSSTSLCRVGPVAANSVVLRGCPVDFCGAPFDLHPKASTSSHAHILSDKRPRRALICNDSDDAVTAFLSSAVLPVSGEFVFLHDIRACRWRQGMPRGASNSAHHAAHTVSPRWAARPLRQLGPDNEVEMASGQEGIQQIIIFASRGCGRSGRRPQHFDGSNRTIDCLVGLDAHVEDMHSAFADAAREEGRVQWKRI